MGFLYLLRHRYQPICLAVVRFRFLFGGYPRPRTAQSDDTEIVDFSGRTKILQISTSHQAQRPGVRENDSKPLGAPGSVLSLTRITLEYNEKNRPQPDRENALSEASGGGEGTAIQPSPHTLGNNAMRPGATSVRGSLTCGSGHRGHFPSVHTTSCLRKNR